jgi:alkylhydroperoxidase family enzyme
MDWITLTTGADPRPLVAPEAMLALSTLSTSVWTTADPELLELARARIAMLLRDPEAIERRPQAAPALPADKVTSLADWPTSSLFSETERVALSFTERFVIDVAGIGDADRAALFAELPADQVGAFVVGLYVFDYERRTELAICRLFDVKDIGSQAVHDRAVGRDPGQQFDELIKTIARMGDVDPITTELVRLRGARQHNCRICQSTRSVQAITAGADESMFTKVDWYETTDLSERHKVALRLTDTVITQPTEITPELVLQVRKYFEPGEVVEIVFDILRNSAQKVAVALAADGAHVTEGVEYYDLAEDGDVLFGQAAPVTV